jgi:hypothetical protein
VGSIHAATRKLDAPASAKTASAFAVLLASAELPASTVSPAVALDKPPSGAAFETAPPHDGAAITTTTTACAPRIRDGVAGDEG